MTHRLYPRLAWQGITKNKRLYLPFLLTCVGMVMMTYILLSLASSPVLKTFPGGGVMPMILSMGSFVMAAFAVLFLFYTNSSSSAAETASLASTTSSAWARGILPGCLRGNRS